MKAVESIQKALGAYLTEAAYAEADQVAENWLDHHCWLRSESASEAIQEALTEEQLEPIEAEAIAIHRRALERCVRMEPTRRRLLARFCALEFTYEGDSVPGGTVLESICRLPKKPRLRLIQEVGRVLADWNGEWFDSWLAAHADLSPPDAAQSARLDALLRATDDLADEILGWLAPDAQHPLEVLASAADRQREKSYRVREELRGWADFFFALGFPSDLRNRASVRRVHAASGQWAVAAPNPPTQVWILAPTSWLGPFSNQSMLSALGEVWAACMVHPVLPRAVRHFGSCTIPATVGFLCSEWLAAASTWRARGETQRRGEELARVHGGLLVLESRLLFSLAAQSAEDLQSPDSLGEAVSRALRVSVRGEQVWPVMSADFRSRARARALALSASIAMRERHDEDWWRNPVARQSLRAICERGATQDPESRLAEAGLASGSELDRLVELFP